MGHEARKPYLTLSNLKTAITETSNARRKEANRKVSFSFTEFNNVTLKYLTMKKLITLVILAATTFVQAQDKEFFATAAVSATSSKNFLKSTQYSAELGMMANNVTYSLVLGSVDLDYKRFWGEAKIGYVFQLDGIRPFVNVGIGNYLDNDTLFIDYGAGLLSDFDGPVNVTTQISNRDKITYLTFGLRIKL